MHKYFIIWATLASSALQETFINRGTNALFLSGKVIRFAFSLLFLLLLKNNLSSFSTYTVDQVIVFYLTYQFIDTLAQVFYRGVYLFGNQIKSGDFDFSLSKPISPLFQALVGKPDINDTLFLIGTTVFSVLMASQLAITITPITFILFCILLCNSFIVATALHILVLVAGIHLTEVDGIIWLYRDVTRLGQFPVTAYIEPLRSLLLFVIPVGILFTVPVDVLLGFVSPVGALLTCLFGIGLLLCSVKIWHWSLKHYQSASS